ncbi:hypothetical protein F511_43092 [Dorcoceras hygrometricum]|uniref:Uncharacterized protein n=1 Tax=Dorcoceras hygrometricum TaxID=472368 RepID=A0A2Z7BWJ8_9LAMI|nr:hypothetical protein F511_43092 [Dorcoceras hygrometricum]
MECDFLKVNRGQIAISLKFGHKSSRPLSTSTSRPPHAAPLPPPIAAPPSPDFFVVGLVPITTTRRFRDLSPPTLKCQFPCESGRSQVTRRQQDVNEIGLVNSAVNGISVEQTADAKEISYEQ